MTTIERAFNECHEQIFNHALSIVKNTDTAEDIRCSVYEKIQKLKSAQYDDSKQATLSSWVHTITNSVILDYFRTNHQDRFMPISDCVDDEGKEYFVLESSSRTEDRILNAELQDRINKAFADLKPKYRRVAEMFFLEGEKYEDIADVLDIPMGSVKGMLSRARAMLQDALKDVYTFKAVNVQNA